MTTIVTRQGKGSPLSWVEADANFTNLNTDKAENSVVALKAPINSPTFTGNVSGITQAMVGLSNVDNTSDNTKNASTATLTNKTIAATTNVVEARSGPDTTALSFRNCIINGNFSINQRGYVSGAAVGAGLYGHDRWKMGASGDTYTFSTTANKITVTIPATKVLQQVIEGVNLFTGTYILSWEGSAQGKIGGGSYGSSGITASVTGGANLTIEFGAGTVSNIQFERGSIATPFEQRPIGLELSLCQRYYCVFNSGCGAAYPSVAAAQCSSAYYFPVPMCAVPTLTPGTITSTNVATDVFALVSIYGGQYEITQGPSIGNYKAFRANNTASAEL